MRITTAAVTALLVATTGTTAAFADDSLGQEVTFADEDEEDPFGEELASAEEEQAVAQPPSAPMFQIGAARALAGVAGPYATYRISGIELDAIVGLAKFSSEMGGQTSALGIEVGARWTLARRGPAALSAGGRIGLAHTGSNSTGGSTTLFLLEAPARIELEATSWLRFHVEGGLAIAIEPGSDGMVTDGETGIGGSEGSTTWRLGSNGMAAGAGFSVAF